MESTQERMKFTQEECAFLIKNYLYGVEDIERLVKLFIASYHNRPQPAHKTVKKLIDKFLKTECTYNDDGNIFLMGSSFDSEIPDKSGSVVNWLIDDLVEKDCEREHSLSIGEKQFQLLYHQLQNHLPHSVMSRYAINVKAQFCYNLQKSIAKDPSLMSKICFSDVFTLFVIQNPWTGEILYHQMCPKQDSQQTIKIVDPNYHFVADVWAGIINNRIIGPIITRPEFTPATYTNMMESYVVPAIKMCLGNGPFWFLQGNAPAGSADRVRNFLRREFGTNSSPSLPSFCCDINPLVFFFWPYLRGQMFGRTFSTFQELKDAMLNITGSISAEMFVKAVEEFNNRLQIYGEQVS